MPHASGVELVRAHPQAGRRAAADPGVQRARLPSADEVHELAALGVAGYVNEYSAVEHILPSIAPHLFPDNFNRRGEPRVVMGIPVSYRAGGTIAAALSLNLSRGGIAHPHHRARSGRRPRCRSAFALPGSKKQIERDARRVLERPKAGMGLRFTQVKPVDQNADRRVRRRALLPVGQDLDPTRSAAGAARWRRPAPTRRCRRGRPSTAWPRPTTASTTNAALSPSAMIDVDADVARASPGSGAARRARFARSSVISAMSAVSSAASLPMAPITMPTSAAASAGASFTPSPIIATDAVARAAATPTAATLSCGSRPARTSSMPSLRARRARRRARGRR